MYFSDGEIELTRACFTKKQTNNNNNLNEEKLRVSFRFKIASPTPTMDDC
jgi:hypothetical protein